jgi:hypothetical protein
MKIFDDLGLRVENAWRETNYSETAFPEIATQALADAGLCEKVTPSDIIRWLGSEPQLPKQLDIEANFGNPPITLFYGPRFCIEIYFWVDGTTEIHQHAFAGAFQVLVGSSIHSRYSFQEDRPISQHFRIGQVKFETCELLQESDVRPILPGAEYIHALFHLDRPSATIAVRTFGLPANQPQYSYRKPFLAIDPFYREPSVVRKLQVVSMLLTLRDPVHDELINELLATADLHASFLILQTAFQHLSGSHIDKVFQLATGRDRLDQLLEKTRQKHGSLVDYLAPVLEEQDRVGDIVRRRQFITASEHRFFLALILNVPSRARLLNIAQERFPEKEPVETVLDWVMDLATTKVWGSSEPNVLGIVDFNENYLFVLECLLREHSAEQIRALIESQYPADAARKLEGEFEDIAAKLRGSVLFRTLLAD